MLAKLKQLTLLNLLVVLVMLVSACGAPVAPVAPVATVAPAAEVQPAATTVQAAPTEAAAEAVIGPILMDKPASTDGRPVKIRIFNSPADAGGIAEYHEAPESAALVASGALPPVKERLPINPLVVQPDETIGKYGGTMYFTIPGDFARCVEMEYFQYELLTHPDPITGEAIPNVAEGWKWNDDFTQLTLNLRKGIRWSDGEPYTADDIMFWFDDVVRNEELTPTPHGLLKRNGELAKLVKIDDFSVQFTFSGPYALFTTYLGSWGFPGRGPTATPKHYMSQFHSKYASKTDLDARMKEGTYDTWTDMFLDKVKVGAEATNNELPTLSAWILNERPPQPVQTYSRNPYYFKVDTAGNQLPYIGDIRTTRIAEEEATLLKTLAGELDWVGMGWAGGPKNLGIIVNNMDVGEYRFTSGAWMPNNAGNIMFNFTSGNEAKRTLYNMKEFRQALSVAINREEILKLEYKGGRFASQIAPGRGAPYFGESELFMSWTQFDPALANEMLDKIGLTKRGKDGYRTALNGEDMLLTIAANTSWPAETPDLMEMVRGYWATVGINANVAPEEGTLYTARHKNGDHDLSARGGHFGGGPVHPTLNSNTFFLSGAQGAPEWGTWIESKGKTGVEPPAEIKRIHEIRDLVMGEPDETKRTELINEVFKLHMDNLWMIGLTVDDVKIGQMSVVKNRIRNVATYASSTEWYPMVPASFFINE